MVAEAHPEADIGRTHILGQRMDLVMARHIGLLLADHRQIEFMADLEHLVRGPFIVLPGVDHAGEFAEIDFRVEIGGEILAVITGIDVDNVDIGDSVDIIILGKTRIGVDDARIEARAEDGVTPLSVQRSLRFHS